VNDDYEALPLFKPRKRAQVVLCRGVAVRGGGADVIDSSSWPRALAKNAAAQRSTTATGTTPVITYTFTSINQTT